MSTVTYRALKSSICFERRTSFGMGKCVRVCWLGGGGGWPKQRYANKIFKKKQKTRNQMGIAEFPGSKVA